MTFPSAAMMYSFCNVMPRQMRAHSARQIVVGVEASKRIQISQEIV